MQLSFKESNEAVFQHYAKQDMSYLSSYSQNTPDYHAASTDSSSLFVVESQPFHRENNTYRNPQQDYSLRFSTMENDKTQLHICSGIKSSSSSSFGIFPTPSHCNSVVDSSKHIVHNPSLKDNFETCSSQMKIEKQNAIDHEQRKQYQSNMITSPYWNVNDPNALITNPHATVQPFVVYSRQQFIADLGKEMKRLNEERKIEGNDVASISGQATDIENVEPYCSIDGSENERNHFENTSEEEIRDPDIPIDADKLSDLSDFSEAMLIEEIITKWKPFSSHQSEQFSDLDVEVDGKMTSSTAKAQREKMLHRWLISDAKVAVDTNCMAEMDEETSSSSVLLPDKHRDSEIVKPVYEEKGIEKESECIFDCAQKQRKRRLDLIKQQIQEAKRHKKLFGEWVRKPWIIENDEKELWDSAEKKVSSKECIDNESKAIILKDFCAKGEDCVTNETDDKEAIEKLDYLTIPTKISSFSSALSSQILEDLTLEELKTLHRELNEECQSNKRKIVELLISKKERKIAKKQNEDDMSDFQRFWVYCIKEMKKGRKRKLASKNIRSDSQKADSQTLFEDEVPQQFIFSDNFQNYNHQISCSQKDLPARSLSFSSVTLSEDLHFQTQQADFTTNRSNLCSFSPPSESTLSSFPFLDKPESSYYKSSQKMEFASSSVYQKRINFHSNICDEIQLSSLFPLKLTPFSPVSPVSRAVRSINSGLRYTLPQKSPASTSSSSSKSEHVSSSVPTKFMKSETNLVASSALVEAVSELEILDQCSIAVPLTNTLLDPQVPINKQHVVLDPEEWKSRFKDPILNSKMKRRMLLRGKDLDAYLASYKEIFLQVKKDPPIILSHLTFYSSQGIVYKFGQRS
ncbi:uncharacterized protein MONOS_10526 [Monocercomonoides exilis]|uniref:uncharacterized protein n=1 Tax=Monocercomonoides exilis TaxID=2049356 RepID=UPI00355A8DD2|nr:hypothetical protein MONOS_10526 [Monocercomonoides exilis]|eukprot:MONOS_10526.1-p1 / transcript=MONOS_10526.1 / gene=MONOS_10526 / organism=Monocercomonoides_exilis_PA203 / gene_product=unspecified product / transcript_product=unspecified product / location=Mono_scaffold00482:8874-11453(+) / protein_length=860 / sequence_SO=supercontig / SO=protein_coding / is_pseudo=false